MKNEDPEPVTPVALLSNEFIIRLNKPVSEFVSEGGNLQLVNPHKAVQHDKAAFEIIKLMLDKI